MVEEWLLEYGIERGHFVSRILFEYTGEKAYKDCQKLLEKYYLHHLKDFNTKVVGSRGIVVHEF